MEITRHGPCASGRYTKKGEKKRRPPIYTMALPGFIGKRNLINTAKQFPYILVPLIIGILRTSVERSETWTQWNIINLINSKKDQNNELPIFANVAFVLITFICLAVGIISIIKIK